MKVKAIVNSRSANGRTAKRWKEYEGILKRLFLHLDVDFTRSPMDAVGLTKGAINEGYELIISVGGDGTLNEVVNGFFENGEPLSRSVKLGVISTGTGADFIKTLKFPKDIDEIAERFKKLETRRCDVGVIRFKDHSGRDALRYFINIADFGIGGETVARVNRTTKAFGGFLSFLWGSAVTVLKYRNKRVRLIIDGADRGDMVCNSVVVANGRYFGGGMMIAPRAKIDDGLFDIVIAGDISKIDFLKYGPKIYKGEHINLPHVQYLRGRVIEATSDERVLLDVDGEQPGTLPAHFELIPSAINVVV
jgi:YegS/Rv2252/BmrU family lipid kinase